MIVDLSSVASLRAAIAPSWASYLAQRRKEIRESASGAGFSVLRAEAAGII
jgi:hypothetical protein